MFASGCARRWLAALAALALLNGAQPALAATAVAEEVPGVVPWPLKSGLEFASAEVRALQQDDFANPGMLWVERGEKLWREPTGNTRLSCASCHQEARASMKGVAARYPLFDPREGRLLNLEGRINQCRSKRQGASPLRHESEELLALTAYVAHQSRGLPVNVRINGPARKHFDKGHALYNRRIGQRNLSCAHCHDASWGEQLLAETISQGHPNAYPAYRLEWQTLGSLARRLRSCYSRAGAEAPPHGAPELIDLELYLAWRANGLPVETPGVRR